MGQQLPAGRALRGRRLPLSSESGESPLVPIFAVPASPSPSLVAELSGCSPPGRAGLARGNTKQHMCHLHTAQPGHAGAKPPDITSAHRTRRLSCGGSILSPGRCQGPGHRLPAPRFLGSGSGSREFSQGPPPCQPAEEEEEEGRQAQRSCG